MRRSPQGQCQGPVTCKALGFGAGVTMRVLQDCPHGKLIKGYKQLEERDARVIGVTGCVRGLYRSLRVGS